MKGTAEVPASGSSQTTAGTARCTVVCGQVRWRRISAPCSPAGREWASIAMAGHSEAHRSQHKDRAYRKYRALFIRTYTQLSIRVISPQNLYPAAMPKILLVAVAPETGEL